MLSFLVFNSYFVTSQFEFTCMEKYCPNKLKGDKYCDQGCMIPECNYDSPFYDDDKYLTFTQSDCFIKCNCNKEMLTNGICDPQCNNYFCAFDLGDCGHCSSGCFIEDLKSKTCKAECEKNVCRYNDLNPCFTTCAPGCLLTKHLYSDICVEECLAPSCLVHKDSTCNLIECSPGCSFIKDLFSDTCKAECITLDCLIYKNATCVYSECAPGCIGSNLRDGICQKNCFNLNCLYDGGDCNCNGDCFDTSGECLTNQTYKDPCDSAYCNFKEGKCGFCNSGCFEHFLGDGICQPECNTIHCKMDYGDCGCSEYCSFKYNNSLSNYAKIGFSTSCDSSCLVRDCHFGIDFCPDKNKIKLELLYYLVQKGNGLSFLKNSCNRKGCKSNQISDYLDGIGRCSIKDKCNNIECSYCFGQANKTFDNCLRQSFDECILCNSSIIERFCYEGLIECPYGYKNYQELADMFGNPLWCLREPGNYSRSNYKEIFVDSLATNVGDGEKESPVRTLYKALVNVYATYTKIYLVNKEIYFFVDGSTSVLIPDIYDPLNIQTSYEFYELWIIGNYSNTEKTIVYWSDNLKISPLAKKFYLKNIEFIGKYVLDKKCSLEVCFYCPIVLNENGDYFDDSLQIITLNSYWFFYGRNCSSYSSVNVFNFTKEVYIENVVFSHFRYQFNSFIKSSGQLNFKDVNFYKMQAKPTGSIVLVECFDNCYNGHQTATTPGVNFGCSINCFDSIFIYDQGLVTDIGAGYNDVETVKAGSFLMISGIRHAIIKNVTFSYNFAFNNLRSPSKGYLIYSKDHLGTLNIIDCEFSNNYVNYLVYIDVSGIVYTGYRLNGISSTDHSQIHFFMNNIIINNTYCSKGIIYYLMENFAHNINITNISLSKLIVGNDGIFTFVNNGKLMEFDINGEYKKIDAYIGYTTIEHIYLPPKFLKLENITVKESLGAKHAIYIKNYPNSELRNIKIEFVKDTNIEEDLPELNNIIRSFRENDSTRHLFYFNKKNEKPELSCNEMVLVSDSVNLLIEVMFISNIYTFNQKTSLGLSLNNVFGRASIIDLHLYNIVVGAELGAALTVVESNFININNIEIFNITNKNESIVTFKNCKEAVINQAKIHDVFSNYTSTFSVSNLIKFSLNNFSFKNMSSRFNNGGCLSLLTGTYDSKFIIKSGNFTGCNSLNAIGGALFIESITRIFKTLFQMYDVGISSCKSVEGSAVFISNNVAFILEEESEMVNIFINNNTCISGGTISDYHYSGNLKINGLEMTKNNQGIYVFYSKKDIELHILNTKIYAQISLSSLFYLNSLSQLTSVYFSNLEIFDTDKIAIEAYKLKVFMENVSIFNSYKAIYFSDNVECEAKNVVITNTQNKVISLDKNCYFKCTSCILTENKDTVIFTTLDSRFSFFESQIFSNHLESNYLLFLSSGANYESHLIDSQINSNSIYSESLLYFISSSLSISNCSIIDNKGYSKIMQVIYSYNSKLKISNSELNLNRKENGVFLHAISESVLNIEKTIFKNSKSKGPNIYGNKINISFNNCLFSGNSGGDIYTVESNLTISKCHFENSLITDHNPGVVVLSKNHKTLIEKSEFEDLLIDIGLNSIAFINDELSHQLDILYCTFKGSSGFFNAIYSRESISVVIEFSNFKEFKSQDYSALTAISNGSGSKLSILNSIISENWSGLNGGGVYSKNYNLIVENTEVFSNKAQGSGGGIYWSSPDCNDCAITFIGNTKIFNNSCENDGGGIKWKDYKPYIENSVLIYNNSAAYGADLASTPSRFGLFQDRRLSESILDIIISVPPGQKYKNVIQLYIYDTYGQVVETENSIIVSLFVNETEDSISGITGITSFKAKNGALNISDFVVTGVPGSNTYLKLKSENMITTTARNFKTEYSDELYLKVEFRNCTRGEQIQATACINCIAGKYNLQASENCLSCPNGASCTGGDKIIVNNGYWRPNLESDVIYECDVFDACLKGTETNELGNCSSGYTGVLCKSCRIGYSKTANGICTKCPNEKTNSITLVLLCLGVTFFCYLLVRTTLISAFSQKSLHSIYIKIFTNYLQLVFIVTQYELEWPYYVTEFFNIQRAAASISDQLFSLDCYLSLRNIGEIENVYYTKLIIITGIPIAILVISFLYWITYSGIVESYRYLKREAFTTIIVLFFLAYPTLTRSMFSNFSCIEIDKMKSYLNENTLIECWNSNHKKYSFTVAIPSIIIWVFGVPTILLISIIKNRKRLHLDYYRVVFGFLYNGYKKNRFYWEIMIMYRKILLIMVTVFKISQFRLIQAFNFILLLLCSIYLQHKNRPFNSGELNNMEMQALNIAAITIYCGLYYLSKAANEFLKILLFIFILFGNCYFILYWVYFTVKALASVFIKFFPRFRSLLKRGDAYGEEDFYNEEIKREGVYCNKLEGKKTYSFIDIKNEAENDSFKYKNIEEVYIEVAKREIEVINSRNKD